MNSNQPWELAGQLASASSTLSGKELQMTIANGSLGAGAKITVGRDAASLFSVDSTDGRETLADLYVRGDDLIAKYTANADQFERELYWRIYDVGTSKDSFALEMIYSLQTDLLHSQPDPCIVSTLKVTSISFWGVVGDQLAGELTWQKQDAAEGCQLITALLADGIRLTLAVYPTDLISMELEKSGGETTVSCRLNADFLEKGVIRRTRMFAICSGSATSEDDVIQIAQMFLDSKTPLTT